MWAKVLSDSYSRLIGHHIKTNAIFYMLLGIYFVQVRSEKCSLDGCLEFCTNTDIQVYSHRLSSMLGYELQLISEFHNFRQKKCSK